MDELWKKYVRTNIAEMRNLEIGETKEMLLENNVSISSEDMKLDNDTFQKGKIARNPKSHSDQWYINAKYVSENFRLKE